jgi:poly(hydroxyalkanoate) depolymerase family esterase
MPKFMRASLFLTLGSLVLSASAASSDPAGKIPTGGKDRDYVVHVPSGITGNPLLILALHALGQTNTGFRSSSGWNAIADREKFVVVYPVGITPVSMNGQNLIGWDITADSDVNFLCALIDTMAARYNIDRKRVYSTGFSMGGMMSYVLACRVSDRITAIGPDAGYPVGQNASSCMPTRPIPVCHVHGADDNFVDVKNLPPWIQKFASVDKCQSTPKTTTGAKYKKDDYSPCDNGNEVICYTVTGMSHAYATSSSNGFSATDTFWAFFKRHQGASTGVFTAREAKAAPLPFSPIARYHAGAVSLSGVGGECIARLVDTRGHVIGPLHLSAGNLSLSTGRLAGGTYLLFINGRDGSAAVRVLVNGQ